MTSGFALSFGWGDSTQLSDYEADGQAMLVSTLCFAYEGVASCRAGAKFLLRRIPQIVKGSKVFRFVHRLSSLSPRPLSVGPVPRLISFEMV